MGGDINAQFDITKNQNSIYRGELWSHQGSILGALYFLNVITDLPINVSAKSYIYPDDTAINYTRRFIFSK